MSGPGLVVSPTGSADPRSDPDPTATPPAIVAGEPWIAYMEVTAADPDAPRALRLVRPDGQDDHVVVEPADLPSAAVVYPSWSPDGTSLAFTAFASDLDQNGLAFTRSDIWVVGADGSSARKVATCELPCLQLAYPAFSPDGSAVALVRYDILPDRTWGPSAVEVLDLASGERRVVTETPNGVTAYYEPTWSPDGRSIAVAVESYADASEATTVGSTIVAVPVDGSAEPKEITPADMLAGTPDWGIGDSIVFAVPESVDGWADTRQVYTVAADGAGLRQVTTNASVSYVGDPVWTADGSRIVFSTGPVSGGELWLASVNPDGTGFEQESWVLRVPSEGFWRSGHQLRPTP